MPRKGPLRVTTLLTAFLALSLATGLRAQFARTYGGSRSDGGLVKILTSPDGGFAVFGTTTSFSSPGTEAIWLVKLAGDGSVEWEKAFGRAALGGAMISACAAPDGGYFVAGGYGSYLWLMKIDSLGTPEWQRTMAEPNFMTHSVCPAADSGCFIIGDKLDANWDAWVIRFSSEGDVVWQKTYDSGEYDSGYSAEPTAEGGCVISGTTSLEGQTRYLVFEIDALGGVIRQKAYAATGYSGGEARSIRRTADGGHVLTGWRYQLGTAIASAVKIDQAGALEWERLYSSGLPQDIRPTQDGGFILVGEANNDILVAKLAANGDVDWAKALGGYFVEYGMSIVQTGAGDYAAAGRTNSFGAGDDDVCVVRIPADGYLGACRFCKSATLEALTPESVQSDAVLTVKDTAAAAQAADVTVTDTIGSSKTYQLCAEKKLLTIRSSLYLMPSGATSPELGSYVYDEGTAVGLSAVATVTLLGTKYNFSNWYGDASGADNPLTLTITDDTSIGANYLMEWTGGGGGGGGGSIDDWGQGGGGGGGMGPSGCFVATAAYRTPLHPAVRLLREFRDRRLLTNPVGRVFVSAYYRWSPAIARVIGRSAWLRTAVRILLLPLIAVAAIILQLGWVPTLLLCLATAAVLASSKTRSKLLGRI